MYIYKALGALKPLMYHVPNVYNIKICEIVCKGIIMKTNIWHEFFSLNPSFLLHDQKLDLKIYSNLMQYHDKIETCQNLHYRFS